MFFLLHIYLPFLQFSVVGMFCEWFFKWFSWFVKNRFLFVFCGNLFLLFQIQDFFLYFVEIFFFCFSFKWSGWFVKDRFLTDAREQRQITDKSSSTTILVLIITIWSDRSFTICRYFGNFIIFTWWCHECSNLRKGSYQNQRKK